MKEQINNRTKVKQHEQNVKEQINNRTKVKTTRAESEGADK